MSTRNSNVNISTIYSRVILLNFKSNHPFNSSYINPFLQSTQCSVTMFFFCILSATEKITSSIKQGLWKMFITIIFYQARFTEFRTRQIKSFSNSKYLAIAFSFKVAVNVLFCSFVHAPECAYC